MSHRHPLNPSGTRAASGASRPQTRDDLRSTLMRLDGRGYRAYEDIEGRYDFRSFILLVDHAQRDPFAAPSRLRVQVPWAEAGFPPELLSHRVRRVAAEDFLARAFHQAIRRYTRGGGRGSGKSGRVAIDRGGQEVLERSSIRISERAIEARFTAGLPAAGRRILGREAAALLLEEVPRVVENSLFRHCHDEQAFRLHLDVVEDQRVLRGSLAAKGLVAFVADGSILPRRSGVDDRPLTDSREGEGAESTLSRDPLVDTQGRREGEESIEAYVPGLHPREGPPPEEVVPFLSPPELRLTLHAPHRGEITGMGVPPGVTLVVGGGFHGKSTLLGAMERGVYDHIPGDGREYVVSDPTAVKIRAEDGRRVEKVDISPFINRLPFERDTSRFSTGNASGSTSQAANIMEALEVGARLLLMDEDTSATNFMIRDVRMQALVAKEREPITPYLDKVRQLAEECGVSTVVVMGGSGDYFDVADTVIMMDEYRPRDVSRQAREVARAHATRRSFEGGTSFGSLPRRKPRADSFDPSRGRRDVRISARGLRGLAYGTTLIDLSALEQLVDPSQTRAIGMAVHYYATKLAGKREGLREALEELEGRLEEEGLDILSPGRPAGDLARPRLFEIAAAINRLRTLEVD